MEEYKSRLSTYLTGLVREELVKYEGGYTDEWNDQRKKNAEVLGYKLTGKTDIKEGATEFWQDMFRPGPIPKKYINQLIKKKGELPSKKHIKKIYRDNGNPSSSQLAKTWKQLQKEKYVRAASGMWRWNADFTGWESVNEKRIKNSPLRRNITSTFKDLDKKFRKKLTSRDIDSVASHITSKNRYFPKDLANVAAEYFYAYKRRKLKINQAIQATINYQRGYPYKTYRTGTELESTNEVKIAHSKGGYVEVGKWYLLNYGKWKDQVKVISIDSKGMKVYNSNDRWKYTLPMKMIQKKKLGGYMTPLKESLNEAVDFRPTMKKLAKSLGLKSVSQYFAGKGSLSYFLDDKREAQKLEKFLSRTFKRVRLIPLNKSKGDTANFVVAADVKGIVESVNEYHKFRGKMTYGDKGIGEEGMRFFIDQLINSMEHYDEREFVSHLSKELGIDKKVMKRVWKNYLKISPQNRHKWWPRNWEKWLKKQGITEDTKRDYKAEYKKFQSSDKAKKYRAELNQYNRKKGTYGNNDGKDASHKGGKIVGFEKESTNRGRREKSRMKKEDIREDVGIETYLGGILQGMRKARLKPKTAKVMKHGFSKSKDKIGFFIEVEQRGFDKKETFTLQLEVDRKGYLWYLSAPRDIKIGKWADKSQLARGFKKLNMLPGFGQSSLKRRVA